MLQSSEFCAEECALLNIIKSVGDFPNCASVCESDQRCRGYNIRLVDNNFECHLISYIPSVSYSSYIHVSKVENCWFFFMVLKNSFKNSEERISHTNPRQEKIKFHKSGFRKIILGSNGSSSSKGFQKSELKL